MAGFDVADLLALEIPDSRGRPTLAVTVRLADSTTARAGVPSGARPGSGEAVERGDRVAKCSRLMEIAAAAPSLRYGMP